MTELSKVVQQQGSPAILVEFPLSVVWNASSTPPALNSSQTIFGEAGFQFTEDNRVEVFVNDTDADTDHAAFSHIIEIASIKEDLMKLVGGPIQYQELLNASTDAEKKKKADILNSYTVKFVVDTFNGAPLIVGHKYNVVVDLIDLTNTSTPIVSTLDKSVTIQSRCQPIPFSAYWNNSTSFDVSIPELTKEMRGFGNVTKYEFVIHNGTSSLRATSNSLTIGGTKTNVTLLSGTLSQNVPYEINMYAFNDQGRGLGKLAIMGQGATLAAPALLAGMLSFNDIDMAAGDIKISKPTLAAEATSYKMEILKVTEASISSATTVTVGTGSSEKYYKLNSVVASVVVGEEDLAKASHTLSGLVDNTKYMLRVIQRREKFADESSTPTLDANGLVVSAPAYGLFTYTNTYLADTSLSLPAPLAVADSAATSLDTNLRIIFPKIADFGTRGSSEVVNIYIKSDNDTKLLNEECDAILVTKTNAGDIITSVTASWDSDEKHLLLSDVALQATLNPAWSTHRELDNALNLFDFIGFNLAVYVEYKAELPKESSGTFANNEFTTLASASAFVLSKSNKIILSPRQTPVAPISNALTVSDVDSDSKSLAKFENNKWNAYFELSINEAARPYTGSSVVYNFYAQEYVAAKDSNNAIQGYNKAGAPIKIGSLDNSKDDTEVFDATASALSGIFPKAGSGVHLRVGALYKMYAVVVVDGVSSDNGVLEPSDSVASTAVAGNDFYQSIATFEAPLALTVTRDVGNVTLTWKHNPANDLVGAAVGNYYVEIGKLNTTGNFQALSTAKNIEIDSSRLLTSGAWDGSKYSHTFTGITTGSDYVLGDTLSARVFAQSGTVSGTADLDDDEATAAIANMVWVSLDGPEIQQTSANDKFFQRDGAVRVPVKNGGKGLRNVVAVAVQANEEHPSPAILQLNASQLTPDALKDNDTQYFLELYFKGDDGLAYTEAIAQVFLVIENENGLDSKLLSA